MWRKFLGVGIPRLVVGIILYIVGARQVSLSLFEYGSSGGATFLVIVGLLMTVAGFMLVNAGLIGAAVGADLRSRIEASGSFGTTPASTSGSVRAQHVTPVRDEAGTNFRGVEGLGAIFIPDSREYFSFPTTAWGEVKRLRYRSSQLVSVELVEDYKTISGMTHSTDSAWALPGLVDDRPSKQVTGLAIRLNVDDPVHPRHTVWFHQGRTVESRSPEYADAWAEAVQCFAALGSLLPGAAETPAAVESAASVGQVRYCAMCGTANPSDAERCRECGAGWSRPV